MKSDSALGHFADRVAKDDGILLYFSSLALLTLSVSPFLAIRFAHHDDWDLFDLASRTGFWGSELGVARPFFAVLLQLLVFPIVHSLSDLIYGRLVAIGLLAFNLAAFAAFLQRYRLSPLVAFYASALVFTLPGVQQRVSHVISTPAIVGNLMALYAGILTVRHGFAAKRWRDYTTRDRPALYLVVGLIAFSFYTYQNCPMFYLLPVLADALFESSTPIAKRMKRTASRTALLVIALGALFFVYKFGVLPIAARWFPVVYTAEVGYELEFARDFLHQFWSKATDLIKSEATLWFLNWPQSSSFVAGAIALGVAGYIGASACRRRCPGAAWKGALESAWALLATLVLVMVANAPTIISDTGGDFARLMLPASALITILLVWLIVGTLRTRPCFCTAF